MGAWRTDDAPSSSPLGDGRGARRRRHPARRAGDGARSTAARYHGSLRPSGDGYELTLEDRTEPHVDRACEGDTHVRCTRSAAPGWSTLVDPVERSRAGGPGDDVAAAPMPGTVVARGRSRPGSAVSAGQRLIVIESMKMQSEIVATRATASSSAVLVAVGDTFDRGAPLVALAAGARRGAGGLSMHRLETHVDPTSATYRTYRAHNLALAAELREMLHTRPPRAAAARARPPRRAGQAAPCASASTCCSTAARRSSS